jgi:hypothetical protein
MIFDNFSDFLVEVTKEELTQILHRMLDKVDVDFDLGRICRIEVHPEFIELFRMGLKGGQWKEMEPWVFTNT